MVPLLADVHLVGCNRQVQCYTDFLPLKLLKERAVAARLVTDNFDSYPTTSLHLLERLHR